MKPFLFLSLLAPVVFLHAQAPKPLKPNLPKAERALRDGKLDVAKETIDITVNDPKFSSDEKAWYVRSVVYAALDTTTNETYRALTQTAFETAKQSFEKYESLKTGKKPIFLSDAMGLPIPPEQTKGGFAQKYFDTGLKAYQNESNYKKAFENVEKAVFFVPEDTAVLVNAGLFFAPAAEAYDRSAEYLKKYLRLGGKQADAYTMLFSIYRDKMTNYDSALAIANQAVSAHPENENFPKYVLDMYIKMNRLEDARRVMEKEVENNPQDTRTMYYLGVINQDLKDFVQARKWYDRVVAIDPKHIEANVVIAELVYQDAKKIKADMNALGISKEDRQKRLDLDKLLVEKLKVALPYWQACEKIAPDNSRVLDNLLSIYTNLGMDSEIQRVEKKLKALGF